MPRRLSPFKKLHGAQLLASSPADHAALSASAGTGKTHVLTARVLRLLIAGVDPSSILCLTFTKAGAAEMADRIHNRLAYWVRLKDSKLGEELEALDEDPGPEARGRARKLFAQVLDATGGGLRIQTIHAFAQGLLAAFPAEAGLSPGFRPLDQREEKLLARSTLADLLVRAEAEGDLSLLQDVQSLSLKMGEGGAEAFLMACARAPDAMEALGSRQSVEPRMRHLFGLPLGDIEQAIGQECERFDIDALGRIAELNRTWDTKYGKHRASLCEEWLEADPAARVGLLDRLHGIWAKSDGEIRSFGRGQAPKDEEYAALAEAAFECCGRLLAMRALAAMVVDLAAGLRAGQAFAAAYGEAKRAAGAVDFDDLIRWTERLLSTPGVGDWVRFKLDQRTDHILVDEAQDTNRSQWNIVGRIAEEYFVGEGASDRYRTIFTVGDFKQAIFRFQGTDPREFDAARNEFARLAHELRGEAEQLRDRGSWSAHKPLPPDFHHLSVDLSYRSAPPVLRAVDSLLDSLGPDALGLPQPANPHESHHGKRPGSVILWGPFSDSPLGEEEKGEEGWISDSVRLYAARLARQIKAWLDAPFHLACKDRALRPEDILILVRRRGDLASLLVARLHAEGVPVAGVDRLSLSAPLAVRDLLAAVRFAIQPLDDLNLASLLVSPLIGWSQEDLHAAAAGRRGPLWPHMRQKAPPSTLEQLQSILAMADLTTPHAFLDRLLTGELQGRRKLLERLGTEARDPIEELLSSALDFEGKGSATLQAFLDWFARGDVEIVRDPSGPQDSVRVMTVHGSKGLQSPLVILADACADPDLSRGRPGGRANAFPLGRGEPDIPIFRPRKREMIEPLRSHFEEQDRLDRQEHWRLLYVAMTRAEERLFIGGSLGSRNKAGPPEQSWFSAVERALARLGCSWSDSDVWGREMRLGDPQSPGATIARAASVDPSFPRWLRQPAPMEERPPRPLTPSSIGEDDVPHPPPGPGQRDAALRGRILHQLFERLPTVAESGRRERAIRWLERSSEIADPELRAALADDACRVIDDPEFAALFGPDSLAEAPIAAVVGGGIVVSGTVDRLLIGEDRILVADFKTGRSAPASGSEIPTSHLRQMAAYRDALRIIFPDRPVEAALLYTSIPALHRLPDALLDRHRPDRNG